MDRRSSPITDLYGATLPETPRKRGGRGWQVVLLFLAGLFILESIRPVMRLRPTPPPSVVSASLSPNGIKTQSQDRMAKACWDYATAYLQQSYPYGESLPKNPPLATRNSRGNASAISVLCWPRLRTAWTQNESWVRRYEWSTEWVTDPKGTFQKTLRDIIDFLNPSR